MERKRRILLVDDHPIYLFGLKHLLTEQLPGTEVQTCGNARAALDMMDRGAGFAVVVLDLHMQGLDGFAVLQAMAERRLAARAVVVSGSQSPQDAERVLSLGAHAFFSKEASYSEIVKAVQDALTGEMRQDSPRLPKDIAHSVTCTAETPQAIAAEIGLSGRKFDVLQLVAQGLSNKEVAQTLSISEATVKTHLSAIFAVFQVHNRTSAVAKARALGMVV